MVSSKVFIINVQVIFFHFSYPIRKLLRPLYQGYMRVQLEKKYPRILPGSGFNANSTYKFSVASLSVF